MLVKNNEELQEACKQKNDELIDQFTNYMDLSDEQEDDAFKNWVMQKLAINEVVLNNFLKQQNTLIKFLTGISNKIEPNQQ